MPKIIVIGSGVIGLCSALALQDAGYAVGILTRELPQATTSMAAGALWSASEMQGRQRQWADATLRRWLPMTRIAGSGITMQRMREVFPRPMPEPWYGDKLPFFARLPKEELPPGMADGYLADLPIAAPPIYLRNLEARFLAAGGSIERRDVQSLLELRDEAPLLVNCSGLGARRLVDDDAVYPMRGQTLLVDAPQIQRGYMDNSAITHIFPRADGVLLGGVKRDNDWELAIDPAITRGIMAGVAAIEPSLAEAPPLRHFSGLRPGRAEVRLEAERLAPDCHVIHNYGHAAVGYTLSWGCAEAVLALARDLLQA